MARIGGAGRTQSVAALLTWLGISLLMAEDLEDGCGHMVTNEDSGTLTSRNYPGTYPNHTKCVIIVKVPAGKSLYLKLADLDIESQSCDSAYLKVYKGSSDEEIASYCGNQNSAASDLYLNTNEATVRFESGIHVSGRGFLINYASSDHPDLITCMSRSSHNNETEFSRYCPAGCKNIAGDISGDVAEGYRDTSLLCKAAIHAGVIADELGGQIHVTHYKGASRYRGVLANGIFSRDGSLSDRRFVFNSFDCSTSLTSLHGEEKFSATSFWEGTNKNGEVAVWSPGKAQLNTPGEAWASSHTSDREWLEIDLGDKRKITGIVTTGSTLPNFNFYVKSYIVSYKRDGTKWRTYKGAISNEEKVLEGNSNYEDETRNNFIPPVVARAIRIIPRTWNQRIAMKVELIGCSLTQSHNSSTHPMWKRPNDKKVKPPVKEEENITEPVPSEEKDFGWKLLLVLIPVVLVLLLLVIGIFIYVSRRNKAKTETYKAEDQKGGCWKPLEQPFVRQQSMEFTMNYASDKDLMQKFDFVKCDTEDYQESLMIGTDTVTRKGSTFKPIDSEVNNGCLENENHYDCPLRTNNYALPLTCPEPEYATPIIERHVMRNHAVSPECGYNVPVVSIDRRLSFSGVSFSISSAENSGGDYQTPHSIHQDESDYDLPKAHKWALADSGDYQTPQYCTLAADGYSSPRDCLKPINQTAITALL
ncbi:discoidin, CUB and LCCL domain-containing protein 1 [Hyperolius riggenbachi]|uniref:discoidin, CUB and LCCL domain-containing protein 1 n=1 Tax=Hyperolius riggenbachi TaxID=752182 RepID=UPI0035A3C6C4